MLATARTCARLVLATVSLVLVALPTATAQGPVPSDPAAVCESRKFVSNNDAVAAMADDLRRLPDHRVKATRYVTLTHLFNACVGDQEMKVYRQGVLKLVNSLGRSSDVVRPEPIDPDETILRINIDDLGWEEADWNAVLAAYPYGAKPDTKLFTVVEQATNTPLAYVRGDWLAFAASQPPLYNILLKLPATFKELQTQLDVDVEANLQRFVAQRAGFQTSGESLNNRMIERHANRVGYLWTTYDFAGNRGKQNLFEFPTGPGGDNGFAHDLAETLFSLPNGFHGYFLSNASGERLDKAPTAVVRDLSRRDLAVTNGISCIGCHDLGIRKARDEIRSYVLANRELPRSVRDAVVALHPVAERMDRILESDERRFRAALERAGVDPDLKLNGMEAVSALASRYEANVDLRLAAAEFGLKPSTLKDTASSAGSKAFALMLRLDQSVVPRDVLETDFAALLPGLTDDEVLDLKNLAGAQPGAGGQPAAGGQPGAGGQPAAGPSQPGAGSASQGAAGGQPQAAAGQAQPGAGSASQAAAGSQPGAGGQPGASSQPAAGNRPPADAGAAPAAPGARPKAGTAGQQKKPARKASAKRQRQGNRP